MAIHLLGRTPEEEVESHMRGKALFQQLIATLLRTAGEYDSMWGWRPEIVEVALGALPGDLVDFLAIPAGEARRMRVKYDEQQNALEVVIAARAEGPRIMWHGGERQS